MCVQLSSSVYDGERGGDGTNGVDNLKGQEPPRFLTFREGTAAEFYHDGGRSFGGIIVQSVIGNALDGFSVPGFLAFRFFQIGKIAYLALAGRLARVSGHRKRRVFGLDVVFGFSHEFSEVRFVAVALPRFYEGRGGRWCFGDRVRRV